MSKREQGPEKISELESVWNLATEAIIEKLSLEQAQAIKKYVIPEMTLIATQKEKEEIAKLSPEEIIEEIKSYPAEKIKDNILKIVSLIKTLDQKLRK